MYNRKSMGSSYVVKGASELIDWSERYNKQQSIWQHCSTYIVGWVTLLQ